MFTLERRFHFPSCSLIVRAQRSLLTFWRRSAWDSSLLWEIRFSSPIPETEPGVLKGDTRQIQQLHQMVNHYLTTTLLAQPTTDIPLLGNVTKVLKAQSPPTLSLRGLLAHELHCGSLTSSQPQLLLTATQLADLALALDTYAQAQAEQALWKNTSSMPWRPIALGSSFLVIAAIATGLYWQRSRSLTPVLSTAPAIDAQPRPEQAVIPPPPIAAPSPQPTPQLPDALAKLGKLNPPGSVTVPGRPQPPNTSNVGIRSSANRANSKPSQSQQAVTPSTSTTSEEEFVAVAPPAPQVPPLPPLGASDSIESPLTASAEGTNNLDVPEELFADASAHSPRNTPRSPANATVPEFPPTLPQVQEVQQYFAQRSPTGSLPAAGVKYRLTIGADGALVRLRPLDTASTESLSFLAMPRLGEPFVSSLDNYRQAEIQLHIEAGGQVTTHLKKVQ
ncbi:MAG: DUF4335 domain-containing protein [Spirulina sp. SIO3F2]|nr:DUF4335 domain-containing protein [Spirulina sp. SIO3F2]